MNSCTKKNEEVLTEVLDLFLLPDYNVVSTTYLDHLLGHIAENTKDCKKRIYCFDILLHLYMPFNLTLQVLQLIMSTVRFFRSGYQKLWQYGNQDRWLHNL